MALGVRAPDGTVGVKLLLEPAHAFAAVAHRRRPATAGAGLPERSPRFIPGRAAQQGGPAAAPVVSPRAPAGLAGPPPAWGAPRGPPPPPPPRGPPHPRLPSRYRPRARRAMARSRAT